MTIIKKSIVTECNQKNWIIRMKNIETLDGAQAANLLDKSSVLSVICHGDLMATKIKTETGEKVLIQAIGDSFFLIN